MLSGRTTPGAEIRLDEENIVYTSTEQGEKEKTNFSEVELRVKSVTKSSADGRFDLQLRVVDGIYYLPIGVTHPVDKSNSRTYTIVVRVEGDEVYLGSRKKDSKEERWDNLRRKKYWYKNRLGFGLGATLAFYKQSVPSTNEDYSLTSVDLGSLSLEYWKCFSQVYQASIGLTSSPGARGGSGSKTFNPDSYRWNILNLDGVVMPPSWYFTWADRILFEFGFRVGLQYHMMPFVVRDELSDSKADIKNVNSAVISAGPQLDIALSEQLGVEIYLRLQYPLANGGDAEIAPSLGFDGSAGLVSRGSESPWGYGIFWFGHAQDSTSSHIDPRTEEAEPGERVIFFSTIEVRLFYAY